ncbi:MAG: PAS domain S-box protein [Spirochaetota bacterium]|nr:PAS domain S-box protein [Spirochaetota bacterium]
MEKDFLFCYSIRRYVTIILSGYTIKEVVSKGYYSILYRGIRDSDGISVLIRVYVTYDVTPMQIAHFIQEFSNRQNLKSDCIVKAFSVENFNDGIAIILEDFQGIPIKEYFMDKGDDIRDFLRVAIQLAKTLYEIHQSNIILKDIKPNNILINQETGKPKIIDLGLSSILTKENENINDPEIIYNTLPYISPELTFRMNRDVDYRTDIYTLGTIFYQALTGVLPIHSDNPFEFFHAHIARTPIPPIERRSDLPETISKIIMMMLSKDPEDRYQSGYGIMKDFETCLFQLERTGRVEQFELGRNDISNKFVISQRIYGRESEIDILMRAFDRVIKGTRELVLITGASGIGKTGLVKEVQKLMIKRKGYFISGKFDQFQLNKPYSALIQAFTKLIRQISSESEEQICEWRSRILEVLGNNGKIITDIIPDVELLIGMQPDINELDPEYPQDRFNHILQNFIKILATEDHPLILFCDNLQWVDSASLSLIKTLITDQSTKYILLIGALCDEGNNKSLPIELWINEIKRTDVVFNQISLKPLDITSISHMIGDTFKCPVVVSDELAELLYLKVGGNPFCLKQTLKELYDNHILIFSGESGWQWDINKIEQMKMPDNIINITISKILHLSEGAKDSLRFASAMGNSFDLESLSAINGKSIDETYTNLNESVDNGLVYLTRKGYRFVHDRIQAAAYALVMEEEKELLHYIIGSQLLKTTKPEEMSEKIFCIVDQLNHGIELALSNKQRVELADLNFKAGIRAKASLAYEAANQFLQNGIHLLPSDAWDSEYDLTLSLYTEIGEVKYLIGDHKQGEGFFDIVLEKATMPLDKIRIYEIKIAYYTVFHQMKKALRIGIEALRMLGVNMPRKPNKFNIIRGIIKARLKMRNKNVEDLIDLPELTDPHKLAVARILTSCLSASYISYIEYSPIIIFKLLNLSLQYGNSAYSACAYVTYGGLLCSMFRDIEMGYRYGRLALDVIEKYNNPRIMSKVYYIYGTIINHWKNHLRDSLIYLYKAHNFGLEIGDFEFASYALFTYMTHSFLIGESLDKINEDYAMKYISMKNYNQLTSTQLYESWYQMVLNLKNVPENNVDRLRLTGKIFNEEETVPEWTHARSMLVLFKVAMEILLFHYDDPQTAITLSKVVGKDIDSVSGMFIVPEYYYYYSLSLLAHYPHACRRKQRVYLKQIMTYKKKMQIWAEHAPDNFMHKYLLIEAEILSLKDQVANAIKQYDCAIALARENGFIQDEAIANELAAKFYLSKGLDKIAGVYIQQAYSSFKRWGIDVKVTELKKKYPHLLPKPFDINDYPNIHHRPVKHLPRSSSIIQDYTNIVDSLQAISSEIVIDKLLEKIMSIVTQSAGASRGVYLSVKDGKLFVEAEIIVSNDEVSIFNSIPITDGPSLLSPVIYYVKRTKKLMVLDDARQERDYCTDTYVLENQSKSILGLPVVRQSRLIGILYLENAIVPGIFTPARVEVLQLLASQAAISLQNVTLIDNLKGLGETLQKSEAWLRRTQEFSRMVAWDWDIDKDTIQCSGDVFSLFGRNPEELASGQAFLSTVHVEDFARVNKIIQDSLANGMEYINEYRIFKPDGTIKWLMARGNTLRDANGNAVNLIGLIMDITDRKRSEYFELIQRNLGQKLNETHGLYETLSLCLKAAIDVSGMDCGGIYLVDERTGNLDLVYHIGLPANFIENVSHYDPDSVNARLVMSGKSIYTRHHELGASLSEVEIDENIRAIAVIPVHYEGKVIACLNIASHILNDVPDIAQIVLETIATQIGSAIIRSKMEEELRYSELLYHTLFDTSPLGIGLATKDGRILEINKTMSQRIGFSQEEFNQINLKDIYHNPDDRDLLMQKLQSDGIVRDFEVKMKRKDGSTYFASLNITPFRLGGEDVHLTVSHDITARKLAEEKLLQSEEKYRLLAEGAKDFIITNDIDGLITYVNKSALQISGYSEDEVLGLNILNFLPPGQHECYRRRLANRIANDRAIIFHEAEVITKMGNQIPVEFCSSLIKRNERPSEILIIARDITERKRDEEKKNKYMAAIEASRNILEQKVEDRTMRLIKAQERLITAERLAVLGQFFGSISHEIKNPLGIIDSSVYYLRQRLDNSSPKVVQHLNRIHEQVKRSNTIIESLRELTQMKEPNKRTLDLSKLLDNEICSSRMPQTINVEKCISDEKILIDGDYSQVSMIFKNIIKNAIEAMHGEGTLFIRIERLMEQALAMIKFEDTGPGIEEKDITRVFRPLFSTKNRGLGFGLSICQNVVERHGGTIEAQSKPGVGATFIVKLPLIHETIQ